MEFPKRKPNRLENYDYSLSNVYFITICTHNKEKILLHIVGEGFPLPKLSCAGKITDKMINLISVKYAEAKIEKYVIMPNHIHLLLSLNTEKGRGNPSPTVNTIIGWLKYQTTKEINNQNGNVGKKIFQRSFYDHIVRNQQDHNEIWDYIENNPLKWKEDRFYD